MAERNQETTGSAHGTALFVRRPILAFVLNALIMLAGIAALFGVEIRELPNVDRPVVTVTTKFSGAAPETVDQELTGRIEGAVGACRGGAQHFVEFAVRPQQGDAGIRRWCRY